MFVEDDDLAVDDGLLDDTGDAAATPSDDEEITFGDEPENTSITDIRNFAKEQARKAAILAKENAELREKTKPLPVDVGPKPKREDFDYDDDAFDAAVDEWHEKKAQAQQQNAAIAKPDEELQQKFQQKVEQFRSNVATLAYDDAEEKVEGAIAALNGAQQSAIVKAAQDPAKLIYALGRNPEKLAELAGKTDLVEFIADVVRLESNMTTRKKAAIDAPVMGNAPPATVSNDKREKQLEAEAERTGDRTALIRYRREKKAA